MTAMRMLINSMSSLLRAESMAVRERLASAKMSGTCRPATWTNSIRCSRPHRRAITQKCQLQSPDWFRIHSIILNATALMAFADEISVSRSISHMGSINLSISARNRNYEREKMASCNMEAHAQVANCRAI